MACLMIPDTEVERVKKMRRYLRRYFRKESIDGFLNSRNPVLGAKPINLLKTKKGYRAIYNLIQDILSGSFL